MIIVIILQSLNILLSKFFPGHATLSDTEIRSVVDDGMDWNTVKNSQLNKTFTMKKVKAAFAHMGSYKSAGPDVLNRLWWNILAQSH